MVTNGVLVNGDFPSTQPPIPGAPIGLYDLVEDNVTQDPFRVMCHP